MRSKRPSNDRRGHRRDRRLRAPGRGRVPSGARARRRRPRRRGRRSRRRPGATRVADLARRPAVVRHTPTRARCSTTPRPTPSSSRRPSASHVDDARAASAAGVAALLEKPPAPDAAAPSELAELDPAAVDRVQPPLRPRRPRASAPRSPGRPRSSCSSRSRTVAGAGRPSRCTTTRLLDLGPHLVDWARWIAGGELDRRRGARAPARAPRCSPSSPARRRSARPRPTDSAVPGADRGPHAAGSSSRGSGAGVGRRGARPAAPAPSIRSSPPSPRSSTSSPRGRAATAGGPRHRGRRPGRDARDRRRARERRGRRRMPVGRPRRPDEEQLTVLTILQFDAASIAVLERLLGGGRLPVLAGLRERGTWHDLEAPATAFAAGAQHSLYSGVPLGEHGLFYPFQWSAAEQRVRFMGDFPAPPPIWERLGPHGTRTLAVDPYESRPPDRGAAGHAGVRLAAPRPRRAAAVGVAPERERPPRAAVREARAGRRGVRPSHRRRDARAAPPPARRPGPGRRRGRAPPARGRFDLTWLTFCAAHVAGHQFWDLSLLDPDGARRHRRGGVRRARSTTCTPASTPRSDASSRRCPTTPT